MATSSPLAALRPSASFGREMFGGHNSHLAHDPLGAGANGFRNPLSFQRSQDYFNVKPVRGCSPAASLAADMSQNFRINESSPLFPTPRRALFTSANMIDSTNGREYVTTPPMPLTSSMVDMMDTSPLPHKALRVARIHKHSPTPVASPAENDEIMLESPLSRQPSLEPAKFIVADRKRASLRRPSLSRTKGHSNGIMASRFQPGESLQPFTFGEGAAESTMSLGECFQDSPPQERRPLSAHSPCPSVAPARPKPYFGSVNGTSSSRNGSPASAHTRRPSNPFLRPRKQYRRALSMFEHPGDVIKPKTEFTSPTNLQCVMDTSEPQEPVLPHYLPEDLNDSIPRISRETMLEVLDGKFSQHFDQKMIVDCRFEYEYEGGHIDGAVHCNDKELLASQLFTTPMQGRTLLIFHCEYSAHRAPIMARHIRSEDRTVNAEFYPKLTYPEVYILEGGYSGFFHEHRERCCPQAYVEMDAAEHVRTCEREMGRLRQGRKGLGRAQTFAFGQSPQDSPTAQGRCAEKHDSPGFNMESPGMMFDSPISDRTHARRMASY